MSKKLRIMGLGAVLSAAIAGCGGSSGCKQLEDKLRSCGSTPNVSCNDDTKASCIADKLDSTCSNVIAASAECG
jgi:hypothetical protein